MNGTIARVETKQELRMDVRRSDLKNKSLKRRSCKHKAKHSFNTTLSTLLLATSASLFHHVIKNSSFFNHTPISLFLYLCLYFDIHFVKISRPMIGSKHAPTYR